MNTTETCNCKQCTSLNELVDKYEKELAPYGQYLINQQSDCEDCEIKNRKIEELHRKIEKYLEAAKKQLSLHSTNKTFGDAKIISFPPRFHAS